jgi:2-hydroxychromene-2-carboxylate isomerase
MTLSYELYWSFRSPYSYMIMDRLVALERDYDVAGVIRPVYPLAVRTPEFFETRDPLWFSYFIVDIHREAAFLGLPFRWPRPDPVYMDPATRKYPPEQPYIHALTRKGVLAAERGRGLQYLDEVSRVIWTGTVDNWCEGDHLDQAAIRAGLDPAELNAAAETEAARLHAVIEESQVAQRQNGHWGVPMIRFNNEPFFGQDRFDQFKWRLEQQGLRPSRRPLTRPPQDGALARARLEPRTRPTARLLRS